MFSPKGNAFSATEKCKYCFVIGMATNLISTVCVLHVFVGLEIVIFALVSTVACGAFFLQTAMPLLASAGIVEYWKNDEQQETDPYDLSFPTQVFRDLAKQGSQLKSTKVS